MHGTSAQHERHLREYALPLPHVPLLAHNLSSTLHRSKRVRFARSFFVIYLIRAVVAPPKKNHFGLPNNNLKQPTTLFSTMESMMLSSTRQSISSLALGQSLTPLLRGAVLMLLLSTPIPSQEGWAPRVRRPRNGFPGSSPGRDSQHLQLGYSVRPSEPSTPGFLWLKLAIWAPKGRPRYRRTIVGILTRSVIQKFGRQWTMAGICSSGWELGSGNRGTQQARVGDGNGVRDGAWWILHLWEPTT